MAHNIAHLYKNESPTGWDFAVLGRTFLWLRCGELFWELLIPASGPGGTFISSSAIGVAENVHLIGFTEVQTVDAPAVPGADRLLRKTASALYYLPDLSGKNFRAFFAVILQCHYASP